MSQWDKEAEERQQHHTPSPQPRSLFPQPNAATSSTSPQHSWRPVEDDLTQDGDIHPNPGPNSSVPTTTRALYPSATSHPPPPLYQEAISLPPLQWPTSHPLTSWLSALNSALTAPAPSQPQPPLAVWPTASSSSSRWRHERREPGPEMPAQPVGILSPPHQNGDPLAPFSSVSRQPVPMGSPAGPQHLHQHQHAAGGDSYYERLMSGTPSQPPPRHPLPGSGPAALSHISSSAPPPSASTPPRVPILPPSPSRPVLTPQLSPLPPNAQNLISTLRSLLHSLEAASTPTHSTPPRAPAPPTPPQTQQPWLPAPSSHSRGRSHGPNTAPAPTFSHTNFWEPLQHPQPRHQHQAPSNTWPPRVGRKGGMASPLMMPQPMPPGRNPPRATPQRRRHQQPPTPSPAPNPPHQSSQ